MDNKDAKLSIDKLFEQLKVKAYVSNCTSEGPFLICDVVLNSGGTFKKVENCSTEIALSLKSLSEPLIYPIMEKGIIRMEIMKSPIDTVLFKDIVGGYDFLDSTCKIPLALGKMRDGKNLIVDLTEMPHLLIGGTTGAGKSIIIQTIINSIILSKINYRLILIDPKRVEFSYYNKLSKLFGPIAKDVSATINLLQKLLSEMDRRFLILEKSGCRDISYYKKPMPYLIVVIDELADLIMASKKEIQELICKLTQKSRACGIHVVAATQRPSVDVVTGLIKANFPSRISCQVSSLVDSRTILDRGGAERLTGKGDAIIDCPKFNFKRFKGAFIDEEDIFSNIKVSKSWWSKIWNL